VDTRTLVFSSKDIHGYKVPPSVYTWKLLYISIDANIIAYGAIEVFFTYMHAII
jgi:hypothetical protein